MSIKYHDKTVASVGGSSDNATEQISALDKKKQDLLTGLPGQVVGFDVDGSATPVQGWSNPNLLTNSRWDQKENIINQRGQEEYAGNGYTIDRWRLYNKGRITLKDSGIFIESLSGTMALRQVLEELPAGTYTISALTEERGLVTCSGDVNESGDQLIVMVDHFELELDFTGKFFNMYLDAANQSVTVIAVKLELGDQQTLAHQDEDGNWVLNDPPPDKALELAKCQRYQVALNAGITSYARFGIGLAISETAAMIQSPLPVAMRARPSLTTTGALYLYGGTGTLIPVTGLRVDEISSTVVNLRADVASGLNAGSTYVLRTSADITAQIILDANL